MCQASTHPIVCDLRFDPRWERSRGFNQKELAIAVRHFDPNILVSLGQFTEEVHNNPFVFDGVAVVGATLERGDSYTRYS
jgi:hypothetical protein